MYKASTIFTCNQNIPFHHSLDPAMITVGPMGGIYPAGRVISLICSATGLPVPNITWYKNDTLLVDDAIHIKIITIAFEYPTIDPEDGSVFSHLRIFGAVIRYSAISLSINKI